MKKILLGIFLCGLFTGCMTDGFLRVLPDSDSDLMRYADRGITISVYDKKGNKIIQRNIENYGEGIHLEGKSPFKVEISKKGFITEEFEINKKLDSFVYVLKPDIIRFSLKMTPEYLLQEREAERIKAEAVETERQKVTAEREERRLAELAEKEKNQNPNNLDRSQYKRIDVSDFSFDMVAGRLPVGSKISFRAFFLGRPTGTNYGFKDVNLGITLTSNYNFVRHLSKYHFESYWSDWGSYTVTQERVTVYVTVQKTGQLGQCSIDIIDW